MCLYCAVTFELSYRHSPAQGFSFRLSLPARHLSEWISHLLVGNIGNRTNPRNYFVVKERTSRLTLQENKKQDKNLIQVPSEFRLPEISCPTLTKVVRVPSLPKSHTRATQLNIFYSLSLLMFELQEIDLSACFSPADYSKETEVKRPQ